MTSAFLPLGGNVEHQILSRKVMVNMKFELGPLVRWIKCFVYNTKVAKMNIYYLFLYLRISPLKMPDIYFQPHLQLAIGSFGLIHFPWTLTLKSWWCKQAGTAVVVVHVARLSSQSSSGSRIAVAGS